MLRTESFLNPHLVERPKTLLKNAIPEGARTIGYLNAAASLINDEVIARIPLIGKPLKKAGIVVGMIGEAVTDTSVFNPDFFWDAVDRNLQNITWGAGQGNDISNGLDVWFNHVVDSLQDRQLDTYSAGFIYAGMKTLSARMSAPGTTRLSEKMKKEYGKMYQKLVTADQLRGGWNQIHADYVTQLRSSGVDINAVAPTIDDQHKSSGMVDAFKNSITDSVIGLNGKHGQYFKDASGKHIFEKEWGNFVNSAQFLSEPVGTKAKLLVEAREVLPGAFKIEKNPEQAASLQNAYVAASSVIVNPEYATHRMRVLTIEAGKAEGQGTKKKEKIFEECMVGIRQELTPLLDMIADENNGIDGMLSRMTTDESPLNTIAQAVKSQYKELLAAAEDSRGSLELKGMFVEIAREKVLEALKKSKYVELKDLYRELVADVDPEGVKKMYARKFSDVEASDYESKAEEEINKLIAKLTDSVYGIGEEMDLSAKAGLGSDEKSVFELETEELIESIKDLNPQLGTAFAQAAEAILAKIRNLSPQKAKGLADVYNTIQEGFKTVRAIDTVNHMIINGDSQEEDSQRRAADEIQPMRAFWSGNDGDGGVLAQIANPIYGVDGAQVDVSAKTIDYVTEVIGQLKSKSAEHQRRFIKAGMDALVPAIRNGNANAKLAEKLVSIFKNLTINEDLKDGRSQLYESWIHDPNEVKNMIGLMGHEVVGKGKKFNLYSEVTKLLNNFVAHSKLENVEGGDSQERKFKVFSSLEQSLVEAIRSFSDTSLQHDYASFYEHISKEIGADAMQYWAQGKLMTEARKIKSTEPQANENEDKRAVVMDKLKGVWGEMWKKYFDIAYGDRTSQGSSGSLLTTLKANMKKFQEAISKEDEMFTVSFLESAVENGFKILKSDKGMDFDVKQRIAFDILAIIGNSESILVKSLLVREYPAEGEPRGAKRVRTLGGLQVDFIKEVIKDKDLRGAFFLYIETRARDGERKNGDELRLVIELLMTYRDSLMLRTKGGKWNGKEVKGVKMGGSPEIEQLLNFENSLVASLESATASLEANNPEYNTFFEILAAIGSFSPQTLERIGYGVNELRSLKNTRKFSKEQLEAATKIRAMNLPPEEEAYLIYTATGKTTFDGNYAENFGQEIKNILKKGIKPEKVDLVDLVRTYRGDVCQLVEKPPGMQMFFGKDWDPKMVPHLRRIFDKYLVTLDKRLRSTVLNAKDTDEKQNSTRRSIVATEFLAASMIFEQFAGDLTEAKKGPHERFIQILSDITVDAMRPSEKQKYSPEVRTMADYVLKNSVPYWDKSLVQDFFNRMVAKINNTEYGTWIEHDKWREMCNKIVVIESDHVPTARDAQVLSNVEGLGWRRDELALIASSATMKLLNGLTTLSGPTGLRLATDIVRGTRTEGIDQLDMSEAPAKDNFILQAIKIITWYGSDEDKAKLVPALEKLGREDIMFAVQSSKMRPPVAVEGYIKESKKVAEQLGSSIDVIVKEFMTAIKATAGSIKPIFELKEDGVSIEIDMGVLPDDSKLRKVITNHESPLIKDLLEKTGYKAAKDKAQKILDKFSDPDELEKLSGTELLNGLMAVELSGSGGKGALNKIFGALNGLAKVLGQKMEGDKPDPPTREEAVAGAHIDILKTNSGASLVGALATLRQQGIDVAEITSSMMQEYVGLRKAVQGMIQDVVDKTGMATTAETAEKVSQAVIGQLLVVATNEKELKQIAANMQKSIQEAAMREVQMWNGLKEGLHKKRSGLMGQEMDGLYDGAEKEVSEYLQSRRSYYTRRHDLVANMDGRIGQASNEMKKSIDEATSAKTNYYVHYQEWLKYVSSAKGDGTTVSIAERLNAYAQYCNSRMNTGLAAVATGFEVEKAKEAANKLVQVERMRPSVSFLLALNGMEEIPATEEK